MSNLLTKSALFLAGAGTVLAGTVVAQTVGTSRLFPDVGEGTFFTTSVRKLVQRGVIRGYESGYFGPDDTVTRAQIAVMLDRYDQESVDPLRRQMAEVRKLLNLGACGDSTVQVGEECDDGNATDGDGCSAICTTESATPTPPTVCPYGGKTYTIGASFPSTDGCNTCTCSANGAVACTLMACVSSSSSSSVSATLCVSDTECSGGTVCSTRYGDCLSTCEDTSAPCIQVCAGHCIAPDEEESDDDGDDDEEATCGNGLCEDGEEAWCPACATAYPPCTTPCTVGTCPQDCSGAGNAACATAGLSVPVVPSAPPCCAGLRGISPASVTSEGLCQYAVGAVICSACGNGTCDQWENSCNCEEDCSSLHGAASSMSSTSSQAMGECKQRLSVIQGYFNDDYECSNDDECRLFRANCPYVTCGEAISREVEENLTSLVNTFVQQCNVSRCLSCAEMDVACEEGKCVVK